MTRWILSITLAISLCLPALAERPRPLAKAIAAAQSGSWENAARIAARDGAVAADIIEWMRLRAGRGSHADLQAFLDRRPGWPGENRLRRAVEGAVLPKGHGAVLAYFADAPPETARGVLAHVAALAATGGTAEAQANVVVAWRTMQLSDTEQALFLAEHGDLLGAHHAARLDAMLWRGWSREARRMFDLVSDEARAVAEARIALQTRASDVDAKLGAVPEDLQNDPGLVRDRFEWNLRKGRWTVAKELLLAQSESFARLGQPAAWANRRRALARDEMRDGSPERAYQLAARHFLVDGSDYADLEWLAGYIALRYFQDAEVALAHFQSHRSAVASPISRGRAGYWIGRAYEALGQEAAAHAAYEDGAQFQTSFYGLLAAERAGLPIDPDLDGSEPFGDWRTSDLAGRDLFQAGLLLQASGQLSMAERFWTHLVDDLDRREIGQLGQAAIDLNQPHLAVMIGKRAARRGEVVHAPYYPLHPLAEAELAIAPEMSLAIARRESEFDPVVQSGAGARGLMQIMPTTGQAVARDLNITDHSTARLNDPDYNALLGSTYLAQLARRFEGNVVLMSAAYNAGPSRPDRWMALYGDPRRLTGNLDVIDWIEHIPFRETRNYVMRVTESLPIYRARLGKDPLPVPFSAELTGSTLLAFAPERE